MRATLVRGSGTICFSGVSIDTRTLRDGNLFFAIRGARQDGHRYIPDALSKGALGAVAEFGYEYPGEFPPDRAFFKVKDTHQALKDLAAAVRNRWSGAVVAVTGSMGKTTTKEFAGGVLQSSHRVYKSPGNYNNLYGLPLSLLELSRKYQVGIFEMGMSALGEIAEMCRIAAPDTGIITNVAPVHLEFLGSIEEIARAKSELAQALPSTGTLIYNADDSRVSAIAGSYKGRKISFGFSGSADVRADRIKILGIEGTRFRIWHRETMRFAFLPFSGAHYVMNALPAVALGCLHGIALDEIVESLRHLRPAAMRGQILKFKQGFTIIDDSYNSNPQALMRMIEVLSQLPGFERRILMAGEMLELGSASDSLHMECGTFAARHGLDMIVGIQGAAQEIVRAALNSGLRESQTHFFPDADAAGDFIRSEIRKGDLVLIKGSRGVRMERIVQSLRSHFEPLESANL